MVDETFVGAVSKEDNMLSMNFQVVGVKKALAAVSKICKAGNIVQFGEAEDECFVMNKNTKKKIMLIKKKGSYIINVDFVKSTGSGGFEKVGSETITIDSGAEESVCPLGWGESFGLQAVGKSGRMRMVNAAGDVMPHYGSRKVHFTESVF